MSQNTAQTALLQKAQQVWTMLDEMAANNPETYKKFIDKQMREASQDLADRNPSAEFCVKIWIHVSKSILDYHHHNHLYHHHHILKSSDQTWS